MPTSKQSTEQFLRAEVDDMKSTIDEKLRQFIGQTNTPDLMQQLQRSLERMTRGANRVDDVAVRCLWDTMTTIDKAKWWLCTCCFGFIGKHVREIHRRALTNYRQLEQMAEQTANYVELTPPPDLPCWAEYEPKQVIIGSMTVVIQAPVNRIQLNILPTLSADDIFKPVAPRQ